MRQPLCCALRPGVAWRQQPCPVLLSVAPAPVPLLLCEPRPAALPPLCASLQPFVLPPGCVSVRQFSFLRCVLLRLGGLCFQGSDRTTSWRYSPPGQVGERDPGRSPLYGRCGFSSGQSVLRPQSVSYSHQPNGDRLTHKPDDARAVSGPPEGPP